MPRFGLRVANAGLLDAAKDVRRWFKTSAYYDYVAKLKRTHGKAVARQFGLNVADLVDWSRKAKVVE